MSHTLINRVSGSSAPVSLDEAKKQSNITIDAWDPVIQTHLDTAIEVCEDETQRLMQLSTVKTYFETNTVTLSRPVRAINAIKYIDEDGDEQTITDDYEVIKTYDNGANLTITLPASNETWVEYVAGYGTFTPTTSELKVINLTIPQAPRTMILATLMLSSHYFSERAATTDFQKHELPFGVKRLLQLTEVYS